MKQFNDKNGTIIKDSFAGLKIVVDATAERIAQKTPSNAQVTGPERSEGPVD